jgi:hypothetical protein
MEVLCKITLWRYWNFEVLVKDMEDGIRTSWDKEDGQVYEQSAFSMTLAPIKIPV